jgi:hypothetical protein
MMHIPKFTLTLTFLPVALLLATQVQAREKWPQPGPEDRARLARYQQHEDDVLTNIEPQLAAWAKKGKPSLPGAGNPDDLPQAGVPAFPGAEGGGEFSFGGRGGRVYVVSNLNDSGPGSFRAACEAAGPRIVVFNVAGVIHLQMPVFIDAPYITIAGQTAPGDGVCIAGQSTLVNTHDVVIRYLRFRRGIEDIFNRDDALGGNVVGNIMVDHCSCSWGGDESLSMYRHMYHSPEGKWLKLPTVNISIQWCIISETLNTFNHALGGTWGGRNTGFSHNLFACNTGRNPSIGMSYDFNFVNNVLFNWENRTLDGGDMGSRYNIISNYFKPGPDTPLNDPVRHRILRPDPSRGSKQAPQVYGKAYVAGNYVAGDPRVTADNWAGGVQFEEKNRTVADRARLKTLVAEVRVNQPMPMSRMTMQTAPAAYQAVLDNAGDTLPRRDPVDARIVNEVKTGIVWSMGKRVPAAVKPMEGLVKNDVGYAGDGIITDIQQVGGYPDYRGEPQNDLGADGIPLWWKQKFGLDTNDTDLAAKDLTGDGYTVMDKYLDGLDPTQKIDWTSPASQLNTLTQNSFRP